MPQTSVVMGPPPRQVRALQGPGTGNSSRSSSNETEQEVGCTFKGIVKNLKHSMKYVFISQNTQTIEVRKVLKHSSNAI